MWNSGADPGIFDLGGGVGEGPNFGLERTVE